MVGNSLYMWLSVAIFVLTYAFIVWDKIDRTVVALSGAALMIFLRILSQKNAIAEIDFNTIGLLVGMMLLVMVIKRTGVFEFLAVSVIKASRAKPFSLLVMLALVTAVLSAFLDNVTTIMLMLPITLNMAKDMKTSPIPYIITEVFASNAGGTATLIGDPPNILIGSATDLSFLDFLVNLGPVVLPMLLITTMILALAYRKKAHIGEEVRQALLAQDAKSCIKDKRLLIKSMIVLGLVVVAFILHDALHFESATIALSGAVLLLLISGIRPEKVLHEIEWKTVFFFIGLFILVGGLKETGVIKLLSRGMLDMTQGNLIFTAMAILWLSAIASAFVDNIPFVTTMIPLIKEMGVLSPMMNLTPLWWALSLGACLGGNGTIVGASANVVAVGVAEEHGCKIKFLSYFKQAFPLMLLTIVIASAYLLLFLL